MKFAVFSDTHLGCKKNNPVTKEDSFRGFDESLDICIENNVDFVIHCGDMFDGINPSISDLCKTVSITESHVMGTKSCLEDVQHEGLTLPPNWINENYCIRLPIFAIHGNHDRSQRKILSPLELMTNKRLINLFKDVNLVDEQSLTREPVSFRKDGIQINLYGIGYLKDDELKELYPLNGTSRLVFVEPKSIDGVRNINILMIHQDASNNIIDKCPKFIDLIICGHEHKRKDIENKMGKMVLIPGSTVLTQLKNEKEHCLSVSLFEVSKNNIDGLYKPIKVPLESTREYFQDEIDLCDLDLDHPQEKKDFVEKKVLEILNHRKNMNIEPYVRININCSIDFYKELNSTFKEKFYQNSDEKYANCQVANKKMFYLVERTKNGTVREVSKRETNEESIMDMMKKIDKSQFKILDKDKLDQIIGSKTLDTEFRNKMIEMIEDKVDIYLKHNDFNNWQINDEADALSYINHLQ